MTEERGAGSSNSVGSAKAKDANERPPWNHDVRVERPASVRSIFVERESVGRGRASKGISADAGDSAALSVTNLQGAAVAYNSVPFVLVADDRSTNSVRKSVKSEKKLRGKSPAKLERAKSIYTQRLTEFNHMIDADYLASVTQTLSVTKSTSQTDVVPRETSGGGNSGVIVPKNTSSGGASADRLGDGGSSNVCATESNRPSIHESDGGATKTGETAEVSNPSPSTVELSTCPEASSPMSTAAQETPNINNRPNLQTSTQVQTDTGNAEKATGSKSNETIIKPDVLAEMNAVGLKPTSSPLLKAKPPPILPPGTDGGKTSLLAVGTVSTPTTKRKVGRTNEAGQHMSESKPPDIVPDPQNLFGVSPTSILDFLLNKSDDSVSPAERTRKTDHV